MAVAILSSCATQSGRNELPSSSPRAAEIHKALNRTVIPQVDLENVSLEDAIKVWAETSRQYHRLHFEFRHTISYPMTFSMRPTKQGASTVSPRAPPKVTVRRKNITSGHLLDEICHQANFTWTIMGRVIVIRPGASTSDGQR
jgi:hypothetical protein